VTVPVLRLVMYARVPVTATALGSVTFVKSVAL
jgi:hypothetical protein